MFHYVDPESVRPNFFVQILAEQRGCLGYVPRSPSLVPVYGLSFGFALPKEVIEHALVNMVQGRISNGILQNNESISVELLNTRLEILLAEPCRGPL